MPPASASKPIRLLVVDDSALVRQGLRAVLGERRQPPRIDIAGEAATVAAAIAEAGRLRPDVVLLDIQLPDGSGLDACREILRQCPETRILVLSSFAADELLYRAVVAGAQGYLMKEIEPEKLVAAIADAAAGKSILTPEATERVLRLLREGGPASSGNTLAALSAQEHRVLALVARGLTNKEIGTELGLSDNTVKNYLVSVFEKLQVKRRAQATAVFVQSRQAPGTRPKQA